MNTCSRCLATWHGRSLAHCGSCHRGFTSASLFALHRRNYRCADPARLTHGPDTKKAGQPLMRLNAVGLWTTFEEKPKYYEGREAS